MLTGDYSEDEFQNIDMDAKLSSLKFMRMKRLNVSNFHSWKAVACYLLPSVGDRIFRQNLFLLGTLFSNRDQMNYHSNDQILGQSYGKEVYLYQIEKLLRRVSCEKFENLKYFGVNFLNQKRGEGG